MRLIDADNVIEKIESAMKNFPLSDRRETSTGIRIALFDIKQMIEEQPTIEPSKANCWGCKCSKIEQTQWIPVSERLPREGEEVLVSVETSEGSYVQIDFIDPYGSKDEPWCEFFKTSVLAWMPLPEPYKVGENDAGQV